MKKCNKCKKVKTPINFRKDRSKFDGLKTICKDCADISNKNYYKKRAEQGGSDWYLKPHYEGDYIYC